MANSDHITKMKFLYPYQRYYGRFTPKNLIFDANLQEFSQRISYIAGLHANGKLSTEQAYQEIHRLWKGLKRSKKAMKLDDSASQDSD